MSTFQIINKDNFDRETEAEHLVVTLIPDTPENRAKAKEFCTWLNTFTCHESGGRYHTIVEHDHRIWRGMEDLV